MDRIPVDTLAAIEQDIVQHMVAQFQVDVSQLLFDATNFFAYINSFKHQASLAQRGHGKEGCKSLRIVGLALLATADHHLPILHHAYPGNQPDSTTLGRLVDALAARFHALDPTRKSEVILVFDKGNNSRENLEALRNGPYHVIGSLVPSQHPDLLAVPPSQFRALEQCPGVSRPGGP